MAYARRILAIKTGADACQASAAAMRFRASIAARGVCLIGMACARAAFAESRRSTSAKYAAAFFSDIPATYEAISASMIIMTGDCTAGSHGGGRSNSCTEDTVTPPSGTYWPLEGGCNHDTCGLRKTIYGMQPASCAPVASYVRGAA